MPVALETIDRTGFHWRMPMAFLVFATALHFSARSLDEANFFWVITGLVVALIFVGHYKLAVGIEPRRHDLAVLMLVVFPVIELNRWLGAGSAELVHLLVDAMCLIAFTLYIGRFSTYELRRLEDRLGMPGMCADSLMISTALLAGAIPVFLSSAYGQLILRDPGMLMTLGYMTPGVYMLIGTALMIATARMKLALSDLILVAGSLFLFTHFTLRLLCGIVPDEDVIRVNAWANFSISAAAACVMIYMRMSQPPTLPRKHINRLNASSVIGASLLVLALPVTSLVLGDYAHHTPLWVWVLCGAACSGVLAMRLMPLLKQALRWKREYQRLALLDGLTGLENRHAIESLPQEETTENAQDFIVFCIDLDDFKSVNDLYGHSTGDRLLQGVADRLREQVKCWQTRLPGVYKAVRLGGDEFLILITVKSQAYDRSRVFEMADELYGSLARWWDVGLENLVFCKASVGFETKPSADWRAAIHSADQALYASKMCHTGPVASELKPLPPTVQPSVNLFGVNAQKPHRQQVRQWTHQALSGSHLPLDLQAIVCTDTYRVNSYEVLARLAHPDAPGERLMPATFLNVVDNDGLHRLLCSRIFETLAAHHSALHQLNLSINIDPALLTSVEGAKWIHGQIVKNNLRPDRITLEILEKQVTGDSSLRNSMIWLAQHGYRLAMDDFGSGHSNLQRLSELPFSVLKVDAIVVQAAAMGDDAPLQSIQRMAVLRNMSLVAEGVSSVQHLEAVRRAGIKLAQGYLHARPNAIGVVAAHELRSIALACSPSVV